MKKEETKTRDEVVEKLYNAMYENIQNNIREIILDGMEYKGLNDMDNVELTVEYNSHFGTDIKIVE